MRSIFRQLRAAPARVAATIVSLALALAALGVFAVPGVAWNSAMQMSGGVLRTFTGLLELLPGLILIPFEADMDPLFTMPERQDALIDEEWDFMAVKIGVNYID